MKTSQWMEYAGTKQKGEFQQVKKENKRLRQGLGLERSEEGIFRRLFKFMKTRYESLLKNENIFNERRLT